MPPVHDGDYGPFEGSPWDEVVFGTYRRTGTWSPALVELIATRLLRGGRGTLLDVGANLGLVSIPVARASDAHCIAFEPEPDNHACLTRNVARHQLGARIELHRLALSDSGGEARLQRSAHNSGDHRLCQRPGGPEPIRGQVTVATARLDDVLEGRTLAAPVVMKVDTQGAEAKVLRGALRTLAQVDALVVEYWPAGLRRMGDDVEALHALLHGFSHAAVLDPERAPSTLQPLSQVLASLAWIPRDGSDEGFYDLLCMRQARI